VKARLPRETGVMVALALVVLVLSLRVPEFASLSNLLNTARQYAEVALVSVGMSLVILTGGIDLSVGSVAGLAGMAAGLLAARGNASVPLAILAGLGVGAAVGALNGSLVGKVRLSPVIVTLATWAGARSLAYVMTGGAPIGGLPEAWAAPGDTWIAGFIPSTVITAGVAAGAASILLRRTAFGRALISQGQNERAALFSGVPVGRYGLTAYLISGVLAGIAGMLMASRVSTAVPDAGMGLEFDAITAVVLGGARISGGYVSILGTVLGVATLGLLHNGCNLMGYDSTWQTLAVGVLLLGAITLDSLIHPPDRH
jgi:ribose transport system permease protein